MTKWRTGANLYALPDGQVLSMPDHMTDPVEAFTLREGRVVFAVRVEGADESVAGRIARAIGGTPERATCRYEVEVGAGPDRVTDQAMVFTVRLGSGG